MTGRRPFKTLEPHLRRQSGKYLTCLTDTDTLPDVVFRIIVFIVCVSFVKQHLVLAST